VTDPLREILRSPLDDLPEPRVSGLEALVLVVALLSGIGTGWVASAAEPPRSTTTTVTTLPVEPLDLAPGWTDVGSGQGVAVTWMYTRGPDLVIGVSLSSRAGGDAAAAGTTALGPERRGMGIWSVELSGGERVHHTREMFDPAAPGIVTIEFAGIGATVADVREISLRPVVGYGLRIQEVSVAADAIPVGLDAIEPIAVTERVEATGDETTRTDLTFLTIDRLTVDWSNAALQWRIDDAADVRAIVEPTVSIEGDTAEPVTLAALVGGTAFLQRGLPPASPTASGTEVLRKIGGAAGGTYSPDRIAVTLTISWLRYGPDAIDLDLTGAVRLDPVD
jgi:hypothetical protein